MGLVSGSIGQPWARAGNLCRPIGVAGCRRPALCLLDERFPGSHPINPPSPKTASEPAAQSPEAKRRAKAKATCRIRTDDRRFTKPNRPCAPRCANTHQTRMNKGDNDTLESAFSKSKSVVKTHRDALLVLHSVARRWSETRVTGGVRPGSRQARQRCGRGAEPAWQHRPAFQTWVLRVAAGPVKGLRWVGLCPLNGAALGCENQKQIKRGHQPLRKGKRRLG